jgi:hypothetical protein
MSFALFCAAAEALTPPQGTSGSTQPDLTPTGWLCPILLSCCLGWNQLHPDSSGSDRDLTEQKKLDWQEPRLTLGWVGSATFLELLPCKATALRGGGGIREAGPALGSNRKKPSAAIASLCPQGRAELCMAAGQGQKSLW